MSGQRDAGFARRGPRVPPKTADETSDAGYKVPKAVGSTRHLERNLAIVKAVNEAPDSKRIAVIERMAERYGISTITVRHVARYFKTPEGS